jgi:hypothetical protein
VTHISDIKSEKNGRGISGKKYEKGDDGLPQDPSSGEREWSQKRVRQLKKKRNLGTQ